MSHTRRSRTSREEAAVISGSIMGDNNGDDPLASHVSSTNMQRLHKVVTNVGGRNTSFPISNFQHTLEGVKDSVIRPYTAVDPFSFRNTNTFFELEFDQFDGMFFEQVTMVMTIRNTSLTTGISLKEPWYLFNRIVALTNGSGEDFDHYPNQMDYIIKNFTENHVMDASLHGYWDDQYPLKKFLPKAEPQICETIPSADVDFDGAVTPSYPAFMLKAQPLFIGANGVKEIRFSLMWHPMFHRSLCLDSWLSRGSANTPRLRFYPASHPGIFTENDFSHTTLVKNNMEAARQAGQILLESVRFECRLTFPKSPLLRSLSLKQNRNQGFKFLLPQRHEQPLVVTTGVMIEQTANLSSIAGDNAYLLIEIRPNLYNETCGLQNSRVEIREITLLKPDGQPVDYQNKEARLLCDNVEHYEMMQTNHYFNYFARDYGQWVAEAPMNRGLIVPATGANRPNSYISPDGERRRAVIFSLSRDIGADHAGSNNGLGEFNNNWKLKILPGVGYDGQPLTNFACQLVVTAYRSCRVEIDANGVWETIRLGADRR